MRFENSASGSDEQPTWRLWGEEKVPGAIYTVYLKKVRYHTPSRTVAGDNSDDGISHLEWETVRVRFIKAGSLEKLVESLASDVGELESTYVNVFLATYRTFATTKQVLNLLLERYDQLRDPTSVMRESIRELHRKTLRQALHVWLDQYPEDFAAEAPVFPCLSQLEAFTARVMPESELDLKVRRKSEQIRRISSSGHLRPSALINQLLSASISPDEFNFKTSQPTLPKPTVPPPTASRSSRQHKQYTNLIPSRHHLTNGGAVLGTSTTASSSSSTIPSDSGVIPVYSNFLDIPEATFAQQLTRMDYELFKRVIPHQCLGSVWSRRDKSRDRDAATVVATVEQFNAVSYRVISTVLMEPDAKSSSRAKVIAKWIDVAQEIRLLKNFSSLKAVISGLQSNPVYRLRKAWSHLSRDKLETFEELARIFSEENNALAQRELLVREGTAKYADTVGADDHHLQRVLQKHSENARAISHGTIPYLGTFLTDLTMIDTAISDSIVNSSSGGDEEKKQKLINFDKRRKEFEVLAQIKLLQGAAKAYHIEAQARFVQWWESVLVLDEREAFELSCQIEPHHHNHNNSSSSQNGFNNNSSASTPSTSSAAAKAAKKKASSLGNFHKKNSDSSLITSHHKKSDSLASVSTNSDNLDGSKTSSKIYVGPSSASLNQTPTNESKSSDVNSPSRKSTAMSSTGSTASLQSYEASLTSSGNNTTSKSEPLVSSTPIKEAPPPSTTATSKSERSVSKSSLASGGTSGTGGNNNNSSTDSPYKTSEFYIIRVQIEGDEHATEGVIMYKSIMVGNHERTKEVIRNAMMKHGLEGAPENYTLSQILPDKELPIPPNANVYYAISTKHDLNFILREKSEDLSSVGGHLNSSPFDNVNVGGSGGSLSTPKGSRSNLTSASALAGGSRPPRDNSKARRRLLQAAGLI